MPKISAVIITYNEEDFIGKCLESLEGVADEIIVVDSYSTDRTEEICKKYNVQFVKHVFEGYRDQKNYALRLANHKTILSLDADEALSDQLRQSILKAKESWDYDGYVVNRRNYFCGKKINFSEWYPDRQLRLFCVDHGEWGVLNFHERFRLYNGAKIGKLKGDLLHWPVTTREEHSAKMKKYSQLGASEYYKAGRKATIFTPYIHGIWGFFRAYIVKGGILDGRDGLRICYHYARYSFNKYKFLRKLNKDSRKRTN